MSEVLVSWREIAAHLRVSPATAQRYHRRHGLPVARSVGRRVRTSTALVDRWLAALDRAGREAELMMKGKG